MKLLGKSIATTFLSTVSSNPENVGLGYMHTGKNKKLLFILIFIYFVAYSSKTTVVKQGLFS